MQPGDVIIFAGPSIPHHQVQEVLPAATVRPPARLGDVLAAVMGEPRAIGIIDGYFEQVPTVWHKEVLYGLAKGVPIYGASSIGAVRAAELAPFGMVGVGRIYDAFVGGDLTDDDEVAVVHAPEAEAYRPLSHALVDIRFALADAVSDSIVDESVAKELIRVAKRRFYADRLWPSVLRAGADIGIPVSELEALRTWVGRTNPSQKRTDALHLLTQMMDHAESGFRVSRPPPIDFESTYHFEKLRSIVRAQMSEMQVLDRMGKPSAAIRRERGLERESLLYLLVDAECDRLGLDVNEERIGLGDDHGGVGRLERRVLALADRCHAELASYTLPALAHLPKGSSS